MKRAARWLIDGAQLLGLSLRLQLGKWYWLVPVLALLWPAFLAVTMVLGWSNFEFEPASAQNSLIGVPLYVIAVGLGVRIIAGEIEQRTLEVTYTVPGGARRVWLSKIGAALIPIIVAEILLAIIAATFFTSFPILALYGTLQGAVFYLVLAMGIGALMRSEITALLVTGVILFMNGLMLGWGQLTSRMSPFFNPLVVREDDQSELLGWIVQNRIGFALLILALFLLACVRAERREELLRV